jgi:hypothetical protein
MKTCFKCGIDKSTTEFYKHSAMADGLLGKCKSCTKADVRANYALRREHYQKYDRARNRLPHRIEAGKQYQRTPEGKAAHIRASRNYHARYLDKKRAHHALSNAIRDGKLTKGPCEVCGTTERIEGHHDDYSKPLEVRWLCFKHHKEHHRKLREAA